MIVVGVQFNNAGKIYDFTNPNNLAFSFLSAVPTACGSSRATATGSTAVAMPDP